MTALATKIDSLSFTLKNYQTQYEAEKAKFVEKVETNPGYAIQWADSMVKAQAAFEAAYALIDQELTVEMVEHQVDQLQRQVRYDHGQSTSGFANAVDNSKWSATIRVLEQLEGWLSYAKKEEVAS